LIAEHSKAFSHTHPWTFQQHDIVKDPLLEKYDLIFSRQIAQHLSTEDTMKVLQHFSEGASYLLITIYLDVKTNIPLNTNFALKTLIICHLHSLIPFVKMKKLNV
jgi:hypothetical protein